MLNPVMVGGDLWKIQPVDPASDKLVDRTGKHCLATTDPTALSIYVADDLKPPLLDRVVLHEIAHAISVSHGLLPPLRYNIPEEHWVTVEEWSAEMMEEHALEAVELTSLALGRPACILGRCYNGRHHGIQNGHMQTRS